MGELHINTMIEKLKRKFGVDVVVADPKVPYRETIRTRWKLRASTRNNQEAGDSTDMFGYASNHAPKRNSYSKKIFSAALFPAVLPGS
jgi:translation elongation factor EF-G